MRFALSVALIFSFFLLRGIFKMKTSETGKDIIRNFEGLSLKPYPDADGFSIGYGHFILPGEKFTTITKEEADRLLELDISKAEKAVNESVKVPLKQQQFDALVSLAYNIGIGAFKKSTMLAYINAGRNDLAALEFSKWIKSKGNIVQALVKRREYERKLFLS